MPDNPSRCRRRSWLLALWLLAATTGCSPSARYQVLTFFFTGVPPLAGEPVAAGTPPPAAALTESRLRPALQAKPFTGPYLHGPYAAGDCAQCHEMSDSVGFGIDASQGPQQSIVPGSFVLPPEQLCVACHASKGAAAVQAAGLWLHGPAWNCLACHGPHDGNDPYFLKLPAQQLCRQCHAAGFIDDTDLHAGVEECLECHNPHMGRDARMLRADFQEGF